MNILSNNRRLLLFSSIMGIILMIAYFVLYEVDNYNVVVKVGYSFFIGGGIANTIDRIKDGYVTDFIYFNIKRFPVFNIADFFIFGGFILILIQSI